MLGRQAVEPQGPMSLSSSLRDGNLDKWKLFNLDGSSLTPSTNLGLQPGQRSAASTPNLLLMAPTSLYFTSRTNWPMNPTRVSHELEFLGTPTSKSSKNSDPVTSLASCKLQKSTIAHCYQQWDHCSHGNIRL
ncbi:hypothetical protein PGT21_016591 [Puccinia graminis f. sp. tritici]|uniref:Uncharacterized protein n=1 Tax=Puccinia graminis f. sp. tritici TaxID=56615 RepID=A0A5B0SDG2_PUCGR|nr:hypothetical protein PGT21_016591 [Puccinia graminis f. sp. tritici]KAA1136116.1 hypothetical protein PGTUg99_031430 [Puccinia graminis f. sp. tritici]